MKDCLSNRVDKLTIKNEGKKTKRKKNSSFCHVLALGPAPSFGWGVFPILNDPTKKIPSGFILLGLYLTPKVVKLTTKIGRLRVSVLNFMKRRRGAECHLCFLTKDTSDWFPPASLP